MGVAKKPNRELLPFFRKLGPEFDPFVRRGTMLIHAPITHLMAGFHFDPSIGLRDKRWCCYFVQPLYVPEKNVVLSWGWRIPWAQPTNPGSYIDVYVDGTDEHIEETIRAMIDEGLSMLNPMLTLRGFYEALMSGLYDQRSSTYFLREALAFTATLLDDKDAALAHVREGMMTLTMLDTNSDRRPNGLEEFELDLFARFKLIRKLLVEGGVAEATEQLAEWQRLMVNRLGIEDLMAQNNL